MPLCQAYPSGWPIKIAKMKESVNLLSNPNGKPKNGVAYKKIFTAEILKGPSYITCELLLKCRYIFMEQSTAWDLEGLLIPYSNSRKKITSSGPEVCHSRN